MIFFICFVYISSGSCCAKCLIKVFCLIYKELYSMKQQNTLLACPTEYIRDIWKIGLISHCKVVKKTKKNFHFEFSFTDWELYHVDNYDPKGHSRYSWCYFNYFSDYYLRVYFFFPLTPEVSLLLCWHFQWIFSFKPKESLSGQFWLVHSVFIYRCRK